jgi:3-deoxy-D-manno-octulosonic-acid transferase/heptosyltransferase-1
VNILIVKLSAIGDVIHTLPAANALRAHYPDAHIAWVVESAAAPLVQGHPALNRVIVSRRKAWARDLLSARRRGPALREVRAFVRALRDTRYDLIIDFQQLLKSGAIVALARGGVKSGFGPGMQHMEMSYLFLNRRVPRVSMEHHALPRSLMLLQALGVPAKEVVYRLPVNAADRQDVDGMLAQAGLSGSRRLVAVNPVAQWETKLWPNRRFARLADRLVLAYGADVVFTGGPEDRPVVADIISQMTQPALDLSGRTRLTTLAALYRRARLVVSTDTGPMHLAAAVGTPVAAVFGPTAPWRTGPFGPGHAVVRLGPECSPCFKRICPRGDHLCMAGLGVDAVLEGIERLGLAPTSGS